ncbi:immunoglobulin superfamily DCC subclass member 3 [Neophocaena asiaeorientalis asiaeorientalis]|uniref:immunoglobulin superfamily DCC subclass member 3 n=1 Tax=Neophocaena asiaeorientalis asiaeorientalis TaxID=1706337 RepID=UPI000D1FA76D|nr:immunoglobulin superfamily DCC subclass member 3 [Neophocaena asiaeorientalis asiaeorientalis]
MPAARGPQAEGRRPELPGEQPGLRGRACGDTGPGLLLLRDWGAGPPKLKSCLTPRPGREGLKTEGRWWAPGGRRVQASLAVPTGHAAGSELAFLREPGDVVATRERPLVLPCRVEGEPPVSISWQRDGLALANDSSATLLPDGSLHLATPPSRWSLPSRAHEYHCVAQNRFGRLVSRRAWVQLATQRHDLEYCQPPVSSSEKWWGGRLWATAQPRTPDSCILRVTLLPRGILHITSVSRADVGTYRCMAHSVANTRHSQDAWLILKVGSPRLLQEPEFLSGPQNLTLTVHQTAVLECIATGHPRPLVSWSHLDGQSIGVEGIQVLGTGNLMISDVSVQHSAVYVCVANRPGTRVRRTAQGVLLVQAPPEFVQWPQFLSRPPGSSAIFTCMAQGVPEPQLAWLKNGKGLSPGDNIWLTHNRYLSTLMLAGISAEDEAIYQCVAENSAGSNQASTRLAVTGDPGPPPAPRGLQAMALSTFAIRVFWEPPPSNGDITGYVLHLRPVGEPAGPELQEAVGKGTFEHVFSSLEPDTVYSIHLRAYSAEGASQDPASIHASTMGSSEGHPLQACRAPGLRQTGLPSSSSHFSAAPAAVGFSTKVLNATSVQASWELPSQLGPIQGFKLFHCKLPAAHFEGALLLASTMALCPESKAGCSCSQDEKSSLPGVVVGIHVGLAALIVCLLLGWRHSLFCRQGSQECWAVPQTALDRAGGCRGQAPSGGKPEEKTELITHVRGIQVTVEQPPLA